MTRTKSAAFGLGALALGTLLTTALQASDTFLHTTHFTFDRSVAVPGAELAPGTYVFERVELSQPDVIVVRSLDRMKVYFVGMTDRVERPATMSANQAAVTLGEARAGAPVPITAWYPIGSRRGHRFVYR